MVQVSRTIDFDWFVDINPLLTDRGGTEIGMERVYISIASQNQSYN